MWIRLQSTSDDDEFKQLVYNQIFLWRLMKWLNVKVEQSEKKRHFLITFKNKLEPDLSLKVYTTTQSEPGSLAMNMYSTLFISLEEY